VNTEHRDQLVELFRETGHAHHAAFAATDGDDPEWPIWYAGHLQTPISKMLQVPLTRSQLVYCLMDAENERSARAPESDWPEFYAGEFIEHCAKSATPDKDRLILYHSRSCPFCALVTSAIDRLQLDVEQREIFEDPRYRDELVSARGRATVPVLRIVSPDGDERWMPESRDIVRYLEMVSA